MIRFECPGCRAVYNVKDDKAGKTGKCPTCQTQFVIPHPVLEPIAPAPQATPPAPPVAPLPPAPAAAAPEPEPTPSMATRPVAVPNTVEIAPCPGCGSRMSVLVADLGVDIECPKCHKVYRARKPGSAIVATVARQQPSLRRSERDDERDDDEDEDEDDRRDRRRRRRSRDEEQSWIRKNKSVFRIISGVMSLITATLQLLCGIGLMIGGTFIITAITGLSTQAPSNSPNGGNAANPFLAAAGVGTALLIGCGLVMLLIALFYFLSGISALNRKGYGRVLMIIVGVFAGLGTMMSLFNVLSSLIRLEIVGIFVGFLHVLYHAVHSLSSFFAAIGPGSEREFNR